MDYPESNINEASIECRRTQILIDVSVALDPAGLGISPASVRKLGLNLVSYSSVHKVDTWLL